MKTTERLLLTAVLLTGCLVRPALADTRPGTNVPPLLPPPTLSEPATPALTPATATPIEMGAPAATTHAPAAKAPAAKKKSTKPVAKTTKTANAKPAKKAASKLPEVSVPLKAGPATVSVKTRVNVRGGASLRSEVLTRLTNGEPVSVIEEIRRESKRADEPDVWAKIALPAGTHAWVLGQFVDVTNKVVAAKKLNVRGGPGENYSVLATLHKGDAINQLGEKSGWLEIDPPANTVAYVAAAYLKQEAAAPALEPQPVLEPAPVPTPVAEGLAVAEPPTTVPTPAPTPAPEPVQVASPAMPAPNIPMILDPSIKREVDREGIVRRTWSIQAPSDYRLVSPDTGENVVYLHTATTNLDLSRYKGLHIIVTGEEGLDKRWKDTPVLTIRRVQVIE